MLGKQQWLVADVSGTHAFLNQQRSLALAAIAARQKHRRLAEILQSLGDGDCRRGLAAAAGGKIADADDGKPRAVGLALGHACQRRAPVKDGQRRERRSQQAAAPVPPEG